MFPLELLSAWCYSRVFVNIIVIGSVKKTGTLHSRYFDMGVFHLLKFCSEIVFMAPSAFGPRVRIACGC